MSTIGRVGREYLAQIVAFGVALLDRLVIPAVFLRALGVASFSAWSIAISTGAFVSVLEFGVTRYFTNRLIGLVEQGESEEARRTYRAAMSLVVALLAMAIVAIAVIFPHLIKSVGDPRLDRSLPWIAVPVVLAAAILQFLALRQALYRAYRDFATETWIRCIGEACRIFAVAAAAYAGLSLVAVAWVWAGATVAFVFVPISSHTRRRYRGFADRPGRPRRDELARAARVAPGLWLHALFTTLYSTIPIVAIGAITASSAMIAQFVLMRTIANFARQIIQMFANLFGIELARRHAVDDGAGFAQVFAESNRFLAAQTAVASAVLLVLGQPLFVLWTGKPDLFDRSMLVLAIAPPMLLPSMMLSIEALAYANRPWPVVRARAAQLVVSVVAMLALPIAHVGLRMMAALALGEVFGLGLPLLYAIHRYNPMITPRLAVLDLLRVATVATLTCAIVGSVWLVPDLGNLGRAALGLAAAGLAFLVSISVFGLSAERRSQLLGFARRRAG